MNETSINDGRIKVLFVITKANWGGAQRYVYDLATHLDPRNYAVSVAAGGYGILTERLKKAGIRTLSVSGLGRDIRFFGDLQALIGLWGIILRERPDAVHLNSSKAGVLGAFAAWSTVVFLRRRPLVIFTVHGWAFFEDRTRAARVLFRCESRVAAMLHDRVILISRSDLLAARMFIAERKLFLIPHGIDMPHFIERDDARAFFAREAHVRISPVEVVIGTIAELTDNKRIEDLIDAFAMAAEEIQNRRLVLCIIGDGEKKEALLIRAEEKRAGSGRAIRFFGFIPDASRYLKGFDIFVLPSSKEGLPYVVMEAMAAGLPVIATSVGGIPDLITDKTDGILVPSRRPDAIAEAIVTIARDPAYAIALGASAKEKIKRVASLDDMVKKTAELYAHNSSPFH